MGAFTGPASVGKARTFAEIIGPVLERGYLSE
jgi:hypothetical protein